MRAVVQRVTQASVTVDGELLGRIGTVSYTHLDVYKRQPWPWSLRPFPHR